MKTNNDLGIELLDSSSEPPPILYKYLSDAQVENVLEKGSVRFTPLSDTNDLFEIRATFKKLAGPKLIEIIQINMLEALEENNLNKIVKDTIDASMARSGINVPNHNELIKSMARKDFKNFLKNDSQELIKKMLIPFLNSDWATEQFLNSMGGMLCFSLSQRANIPPMWGNYANNHKGFVIAFDTESAWFKEKSDGSQKRLHEVKYFDGQLEEALDDMYKTISSKTADWAYEREWRVYSNKSHADSIKQTPEESIYLINFPPEAVQRIILGEKTKPDVEKQIKEIARAKYPHAEIYRMKSDPLTTTTKEIKI